jgi:hypothetical protein
MVNVRDEQPEPLIVPLSTDGSEALTFDVGDADDRPIGWAAFHSAETRQHHVLLRFGPETSSPDAAIEIRELHIAAGDGSAFNSPFLRTVPLSRIVAAVNRPGVAEQIRPMLGPVNMIMSGHVAGSSGMWAWQLPPREKVPLQPKRLHVKDPGTRRKPDDFYRRVAEVYLEQASISDKPAQRIAAANGVPKTTVHRWLKEARRRGLLRLPHQHGEEQQ